MKITLMLEASVIGLRVTEVLVLRMDKVFLHFGGRKSRWDNGYTKYFAHTEWDAAKDWIVNKRTRWSEGHQITKEQIDEYKEKSVSDKERAAGKFSRNEKGRTPRGLSASQRR